VQAYQPMPHFTRTPESGRSLERMLTWASAPSPGACATGSSASGLDVEVEMTVRIFHNLRACADCQNLRRPDRLFEHPVGRVPSGVSASARARPHQYVGIQFVVRPEPRRQPTGGGGSGNCGRELQRHGAVPGARAHSQWHTARAVAGWCGHTYRDGRTTRRRVYPHANGADPVGPGPLCCSGRLNHLEAVSTAATSVAWPCGTTVVSCAGW